ncbi:hypothetical protein BN2476_70046 [Paraburkholderia piptadeniae]|uniref:Uncharacterized protein n=1 Tax=Paraburkholderia piptadeniae TaxID=1701573 RepID=A0A1N7RLB0_9BURK|nr:hypothetical protein BN2476_70046 [Paraburkholderia piptadeniae]
MHRTLEPIYLSARTRMEPVRPSTHSHRLQRSWDAKYLTSPSPDAWTHPVNRDDDYTLPVKQLIAIYPYRSYLAITRFASKMHLPAIQVSRKPPR